MPETTTTRFATQEFLHDPDAGIIGDCWRAGIASMGEEPEYPPHRPAGWRIEVDGRTVLAVTDDEMRTPWTPPPVPLWQRMRRAWAEQWRTDVDRVMGRLGWHRDSECGGEW